MKYIMIDQAHKNRRSPLSILAEDLLYIIATVITIVALLVIVVDVISVTDNAPQDHAFFTG